jgi:hypothetical protein
MSEADDIRATPMPELQPMRNPHEHTAVRCSLSPSFIQPMTAKVVQALPEGDTMNFIDRLLHMRKR